ncbi:MAG: YncE family protein [Actinomycetes bacterium]
MLTPSRPPTRRLTRGASALLVAASLAACSSTGGSGGGTSSFGAVHAPSSSAAARTTAGGSTAGGSTAGGSTAGGSTAGTSGTAASGTATSSTAASSGGTGSDVVNVYAADTPGNFAPAAVGAPALVYVPDTLTRDVYVISQATRKVVGHYRMGGLNQHVVPSWDLRTLWVTASTANELIGFDPLTGKPDGRVVHVSRPYNLYFTTDGRYAVVVSEEDKTLRFLRTSDYKEVHDLDLPGCDGVDHMDYSADGQTGIATCEFSGMHNMPGKLAVIDMAHQKLLRYITLPRNAMPQDVKLSPDGRTFYVADMVLNGVHVIDAATLHVTGFLKTGKECHGLYVSRDEETLYITNRGEGSISLLDFATGKLVGKWQLPGKASPDMGNVSADGKVLWLSGRYNAEVYAIDTSNGHLLARIPVGSGPHGLTVWPQPGTYSIGHTGIMR